MPVVLRERGFEVRIFLPSREHGPAHVHVTHGNGEALILLNTAEQGVSVREIRGMKSRDVQRAVLIVARNAAYLREEWRKYHGE